MTPRLLVLSATILCACAGAPPPALPPALDPSNPDAPEAKPLQTSTALAPEPAVAEEPPPQPRSAGQRKSGDEARPAPPAGGHHHGDAHPREQGAPERAADFTCPMHPEISEPGPARCPKCGMPLEPRKGGAPPGSAGKAEPAPHDHAPERDRERR